MIIYSINTETSSGLRQYLELLKPSSWLFQAIEKEFDKWIDSENPAMEYEEMYFGDEAILTKKGAIQGAIEMIFDIMNEENKPFIYLKDVDLAAAFQY